MGKRRGVSAGQATTRLRMVLAQRASGLSVAEFCRRKGIPSATFYLWRRRVEDESRGFPGNGGCLSSPDRVRHPFAEVRVLPEDAGELLPSPSRVEIVLSSGDRISLSEACDPSWLEGVVRILRSGTC